MFKTLRKWFSLFEMLLVLAVIAWVIAMINATAGSAFRNKEDNQRMNIAKNILPSALNSYYGKYEAFPEVWNTNNAGFIKNQTGSWIFVASASDTSTMTSKNLFNELNTAWALTRKEFSMLIPPKRNEKIWFVVSSNLDWYWICVLLNWDSNAAKKSRTDWWITWTAPIFLNVIWNPTDEADFQTQLQTVCTKANLQAWNN